MEVTVKQHSELTRWVQDVDSVEGASHCWVVFARGTRKKGGKKLENGLYRTFKCRFSDGHQFQVLVIFNSVMSEVQTL